MPSPSERRTNNRLKIKIPVELYVEGNNTPFRCATSDLSLVGCYIESMFPFAVGTILDLKLQANATLVVQAIVVTSDPQVGNGIKFTKMLPEDVEELKAFLESAEKETADAAKNTK